MAALKTTSVTLTGEGDAGSGYSTAAIAIV
jgi:hypothetical protein